VERGADVSARDAEGQSVDDLLDASADADEIRRHLEQLRSHDAEKRPVDP
jgi:hypothetical protein